MAPRPFRVAAAVRETADTVTLELVPPAAAAELASRPGQFNMLYLPGVGEVPISVSGDASSRGRLVHTVRRAGAVTQALCALSAGDFVGVRGPFGTPWPLESAEERDVVVVAGGIGLAPLRPVVYHLIEHRRRFGRVAILYGTRSPSDLLYRVEVERWRGRFDFDVQVTVDHAGEEWRGRVGVVTTLVRQVQLDADQALAMVCGPEIMMRFTVRELEGLGLEGDDIYLSLERNMKCAVGWCGHCQLGPELVCRDGPVFRYRRIRPLLEAREL